MSLNTSETPIITFDKSAKEQVRVSATEYLGRPYIDLRIFAHKTDGTYIPTTKGITLSRDLFSLIFNQTVAKLNETAYVKEQSVSTT